MFGLGERRDAALRRHYEAVWGRPAQPCVMPRNPTSSMPGAFSIVKFAPGSADGLWVYATVGMSRLRAGRPIELHMFSQVESAEIAEVLTVTAHYHMTGAPLGLHHSVNLGRGWLGNSSCDHALISLPYRDGPRLEIFRAGLKTTRCYWLLPITEREVDFKKAHGTEALEQRFEAIDVPFADPLRESVV